MTPRKSQVANAESNSTVQTPTTLNSASSFDADMGAFAVTDYQERLYSKVFYSIRERQGFLAKRQLGANFSWGAFKAKFTETFGSPEERKYTLEQLLDYAMQKFGMTQADLVTANQRSWERRKTWELKQATRLIANSSSIENHYDSIPY